MPHKNYAEFYTNVPAEQCEEYLKFRETHAFRSHRVDNITWEYIDTQTPHTASTPLLILVGGLRVADAGYRAITMLENERRIVVPTYPALKTMNALTDGIVGLLDKLNIEKVDVLSGSFGGLVAQGLVQRHGQTVRKLILSSTGLMTESTIAERRKTLRLLRLLPNGLVRRFTQRRLFTIINPPVNAHSFWRAYLKELFSQRLAKPDVLSTIACMIDFGENVQRTAQDPLSWDGDVLIISSEDDHTFREGGQHHLHTLFPTAEVFTFSNAGHSPSITQADNYFRRIHEFLNT